MCVCKCDSKRNGWEEIMGPRGSRVLAWVSGRVGFQTVAIQTFVIALIIFNEHLNLTLYCLVSQTI